MADEPVSPAAPVAPAAPAPAPEAAPAAPVAPVAPVAEAAPVAPAAEAPKAEPAAETKPEPAKAEAPQDVTATSLLSEAKPKEAAKPEGEKPAEEKPAEVKPAEAAKPEGEAKPAEVKPEEAKPAEPVKVTFEPLKLPEGVKLDDARVAAADELLGKFELEAKVDHAQVQNLRQQLVDFHVQEVQRLMGDVQTQQRNVWERTRESWRNEFVNDPDIGGNRQQTTLNECGAFLESYGAKFGADREAKLRYAFRITGIGDHPEMIRALHWASNFTAEKAKPIPAVSAKAPAMVSKAAARYPSLTRTNGAA